MKKFIISLLFLQLVIFSSIALDHDNHESLLIELLPTSFLKSNNWYWQDLFRIYIGDIDFLNDEVYFLQDYYGKNIREKIWTHIELCFQPMKRFIEVEYDKNDINWLTVFSSNIQKLVASNKSFLLKNNKLPGDKKRDKLLAFADLGHARLEETNLSKANLTRAVLFNADLFAANLSGSNLNKADLSHARLIYANLTQANLEDANFSSANLTRANLKGAKLQGADMRNAFILDNKWNKIPITKEELIKLGATLNENQPIL
jgi:uncharacterized protein YjbI with pentapeptide repeats